MSNKTTMVRIDAGLSTQLSILSRKWDLKKGDVIQFLINNSCLEALTSARNYEIITELKREHENELRIENQKVK